MNRRTGLLLALILVLWIPLAGCQSKTTFNVPKESDIDSVEYIKWALAPDNPAPLTSDNEHDRAIISKLAGYLREAKTDGYDEHVPWFSAPGAFAYVILKDKSQLTLSCSMDSGVVDVLDSKTHKYIRIISQPLVDWLTTGWEADLAGR